MKGINLLEKSVIETKDVRELKRKVTILSVTIAIFFALVNLGIFIYRQNLTNQLEKLNLAATQQTAVINSFRNKEIQYYVLKEKLNTLSTIKQSRLDVPAIIAFFQQLESLGINIQNLFIAAGQVNFSAITPNTSILIKTLASVAENEESIRLFKTVLLGGLSRAGNGEYSFTINLKPNL